MTQLVVISLIALVHGKEMIKCRFKLSMLQCFHNGIFMYTIYIEILEYNIIFYINENAFSMTLMKVKVAREWTPTGMFHACS